jgi:hypothetical protein
MHTSVIDQAADTLHRLGWSYGTEVGPSQAGPMAIHN